MINIAVIIHFKEMIMAILEIREFDCCSCGKHVVKKCKESSKYCSIECYRNGNRPSIKKKGAYKNCSHCGKDIYVQLSQIKEHNFCNSNCHNSYQGRNKKEFICKICNTPFKLSKSLAEAEGRNPTYCSIDCRNLCVEWKRKSVIAGNNKLQNSKSPTKLEIFGYNILSEIGISYEKQFIISDKFTVDVFIKEHNLVIQWDGDYWHGYKKSKNGELDKRQTKRMALDKSQDAYMKTLGFKILRFWEHEVFNERENVIETIKRTIQQPNT